MWQVCAQEQTRAQTLWWVGAALTDVGRCTHARTHKDLHSYICALAPSQAKDPLDGQTPTAKSAKPCSQARPRGRRSSACPAYRAAAMVSGTHGDGYLVSTAILALVYSFAIAWVPSNNSNGDMFPQCAILRPSVVFECKRFR